LVDELELLEDGAAAALELLEDGAAAALELLEDGAAAALELLADGAAAALELLADGAAAALELLADGAAAALELLEDGAAAALELLEDGGEVVCCADACCENCIPTIVKEVRSIAEIAIAESVVTFAYVFLCIRRERLRYEIYLFPSSYQKTY
jgi:hypothetical protein